MSQFLHGRWCPAILSRLDNSSSHASQQIRSITLPIFFPFNHSFFFFLFHLSFFSSLFPSSLSLFFLYHLSFLSFSYPFISFFDFHLLSLSFLILFFLFFFLFSLPFFFLFFLLFSIHFSFSSSFFLFFPFLFLLLSGHGWVLESHMPSQYHFLTWMGVRTRQLGCLPSC